MKITLRKANALQTAIQDQIKGITISTTVEINEFQKPATVLEIARQENLDAFSRQKELYSILYGIRMLISKANAKVGIDDRLAQSACIDKQLVQLKIFSEAQPTEDLSITEQKLEKIRNRADTARAYYDKDSVPANLLTEKEISKFKNEVLELKKGKQKLNDEILELNVKTEIELSDDVVKVLRSENLI